MNFANYVRQIIISVFLHRSYTNIEIKIMEEEIKHANHEEITLDRLPSNIARRSSSRANVLQSTDKMTCVTMVQILVAAVVLLVERNSFISALCFAGSNLLTILVIVSALNTVYYYVYTLVSKKKHKIALYAAFKLSRTPPISLLTIAFLGYSSPQL
eukprot:TRINITY_DN5765_c0_g1_i11.p1 TRINITY_DN5765_c0_g1~~TRINITY_DN5765_c0_g1_i11.p1  ORF type:complete len:157 (+),score=25.39 TRINITY_DN5765_c0_g1_i11:114-584(+)